MREPKPSVCFYYFSGTSFHLNVPQFINSIFLWQREGYPVTLYSLAKKGMNSNLPTSSLMDNCRCIEIRLPFLVVLTGKVFNGIEKLLRVMQQPKSGFRVDKYTVSYLIESFYFCLACYLKTNKKLQSILIAKDPQGLLIASALKRKCRKNLIIYWPLELWIGKDIKRMGLKIFKSIEKKLNKYAFCTIEGGKERCDLLRKENKLADQLMISIPNSPLGKAKTVRNSYFNEKFNIPLDKKIVLHAGSATPGLMTYEVIGTLNTWPSDCVFVLHGLIGESVMKEIQKIIKRKKLSNVYLSSDMVTYDQIHEVYSSADIGLLFFRPDTINNRYIGLASGKLFQYMKAGIPVILNDLVGPRELVVENGFGVCVENVTEIGDGISRILQDEATYKRNAVQTFDRFRFEPHHSKLVDLVEGTGLRGTLNGEP